MLAPQIESYIATQLIPMLPSSIHHSEQMYNEIKKVSSYLHNAIGILSSNLPVGD